MRSKYLLCIDAGGTFFKYGVFTPEGECLGGVNTLPSHSDGKKEDILASYRELICSTKQAYPLSAIGISTPGPFDYLTGTSHMKHKFQGIYKVGLKEELLKISNTPSFFLSDTNAFLLGEYTNELQKNYQDVLGVTLGTGLGMSIIHRGSLLTTPQGGVVEKPFSDPYQNGIAEDVISARGLSHAFDGKMSAKEIALLAKQGNQTAREVYRSFGIALQEVLKPYVRKYNAELLILGGQIAKSADLFQDELSGLNIDVTCAQYGEEAALKGICVHYQSHCL